MFIAGYRLLNLRNNLGNNSTDLHIVEVMLENINEIDKLSIETMAELCDVSKSKISKFVKSSEILREMKNVVQGIWGMRIKL